MDDVDGAGGQVVGCDARRRRGGRRPPGSAPAEERRRPVHERAGPAQREDVEGLAAVADAEVGERLVLGRLDGDQVDAGTLPHQRPHPLVGPHPDSRRHIRRNEEDAHVRGDYAGPTDDPARLADGWLRDRHHRAMPSSLARCRVAAPGLDESGSHHGRNRHRREHRVLFLGGGGGGGGGGRRGGRAPAVPEEEEDWRGEGGESPYPPGCRCRQAQAVAMISSRSGIPRRPARDPTNTVGTGDERGRIARAAPGARTVATGRPVTRSTAFTTSSTVFPVPVPMLNQSRPSASRASSASRWASAMSDTCT